MAVEVENGRRTKELDAQSKMLKNITDRIRAAASELN
jgi:hypothetical protein